jgi:antitoxin ChpS
MRQNAGFPLSDHEYQALSAFLKRALGEHPGYITDAILFGSRARRDYHAESDVDILLITTTEDWRFKHAISNIAADIGLECDLIIDARIIGSERWDRMRREHFSLYENITRDGIPFAPAFA